MSEQATTGGALPKFFVVGGQKCGTTTIYSLLRQHPGIFLPDLKETQFFHWHGRTPDFTDPAAQVSNSRAVIQRAEYEALYAGAGDRLSGEVCPIYLYSPEAAGTIAAAIPDARIIAILREPVARSFSAYRHMQARASEEAASFAGALAAEAQHIRDGWQFMAHYAAASRYAPQLKRYHDAFGRDRVLTIAFDDLERDPIATANRMLAWLDLTPLPDEARMGQTNRTVALKSGLARELLLKQTFGVFKLRRFLPRAYRGRVREWLLRKFSAPAETVDPQTRASLTAAFLDDIEEVERMTGLDLSGWKA